MQLQSLTLPTES